MEEFKVPKNSMFRNLMPADYKPSAAQIDWFRQNTGYGLDTALMPGFRWSQELQKQYEQDETKRLRKAVTQREKNKAFFDTYKPGGPQAARAAESLNRVRQDATERGFSAAAMPSQPAMAQSGGNFLSAALGGADRKSRTRQQRRMATLDSFRQAAQRSRNL